MKDKKDLPLYQVRPVKDIKQILNESCELFKDKIAYYSKYKSDKLVPIKFSQLKEDVDALGTAFHKLGLEDKKIAIIGENRYEWAVSYLSAITGNSIVVPIDKQLPLEELLISFSRVDISAIVFSGKLLENIEKITIQHEIPFLINMDLDNDNEKYISFNKLLEMGKEELKNGNRSFVDAVIDNKKLAALLFTSGTSAESKIVMLNHSNIAFNIENQCKLTNVHEKDTFLSILPLHHTYECTCGFLTLLYKGCTVAYLDNLRNLQNTMKETKTTVMLAVPAILEFMYKQIREGIRKQGKTAQVDFMIKVTNALDKCGIHLKKKVFKQIHDQFGGELRMLIAGAAAIKPEVAQGFRDLGILAIQGYGLTECAPIVALNRDVWFKDDAAGLPLPQTEVKIADPNSEGIGEIITKGGHVMMGYYQDELSTAETIKDGWLYTGDLGFIDNDGFVHITGRKKNVIVLNNGKNIYPEEIEPLVNECEYIKECLVYGKQTNNDIILTAQIIVDYDHITEKFSEEKTPEEIKNLIWEEIKKVNEKLVIYKHIKNIEIREKEFEKTTTLKIKRYKEI